ncbi:peptidoglycan-recognition protein LC [Drosophila santomea]|uniref:peptidoglycan-recognition protein LC n=1 Tax=Drosophila santomea TaxID=129105 RepID=UPI001953BD09|nr:peptidoglycan-recognition protein LC [Drosophila santomea]
MHFSNETEMSQCPNAKCRVTDPLSGPKNCSTSSTDSGVILNDNAATFRPETDTKTESKDRGTDKGQSQSKSEEKTEPKRISVEHTVHITNDNAGKTSSPAVSIRSTTISVVSIDDNAIDSSSIASDSEAEAEDYTVQKLGRQVTYPPNSSHLRDLNQGLTVVSRHVAPAEAAAPPPNPLEAGVVAKQILNGNLALATPTSAAGGATQGIGSIALTNSTDVTFGDKHFYEGPVTIQQFLIDNRDKWKPGEGPAGGQDNPAFNGAATTNGSATGSKHEDPAQTPPLCPFLPNTVGRKAVTITVVFVTLTFLLGIVLATTTNLFGKTLNQSKIKDEDEYTQNIPINSTIDLDNIGSGLILRFVERQQWLAQPPQRAIPDLELPVRLVIALPTNSENCSTQAECVRPVRLLQSFFIESLQKSDIAYNFLIGGDGNVYVGRGWDKVGAHMNNSFYDSRSLSFAYIGSFKTLQPSEKQLSVTRLLLARGVKLGKIAPDYRFTASSKLMPTVTDFKADALYKSFANWTHWSYRVRHSSVGIGRSSCEDRYRFVGSAVSTNHLKMPKTEAVTSLPKEPTINAKRFRLELLYLCVVLLMVVALAAGYFTWMMSHSTSSPNKGLHILDRSEWQGEPPSGMYPHLKLPVANVIIHHTATEGCDQEDVCIYRMKIIQAFHMKSMGWVDIGYNFLVGGDGQIYVGRGWHIQGQHVKGYGAISVSIAFIGTFVNMEPPARQIEAAMRLMDEGVRLHRLQPDYHIYAHRQVSPTESPGQKLCELMQNWPRFTQDATSLRLLRNETVKLVTRPYWLAQPPIGPLTPLKLPIESVRFVATNTTSCSTQAECTFRVRLLQNRHIESNGYKDINYNFVAAGDENIYEARGWDHSCEPPKNGDELVVAFVGPSSSNKKIALELIKHGIKLGHISENYTLIDDSEKS